MSFWLSVCDQVDDFNSATWKGSKNTRVTKDAFGERKQGGAEPPQTGGG